MVSRPPTAPCRRRVLAAALALHAVMLAGCGRENRQLIANLSSRNVVVRETAIEQAGLRRLPPAAPPIRALLETQKNRETRILCVTALGRIGDTNAVDLIVPLLQEPDSALALAAVEALGKIRDPRAVPALGGSLAATNLNLAAIWALGHIGDEKALEVLTPLLSSDDRFVRHNARRALRQLNSRD